MPALSGTARSRATSWGGSRAIAGSFAGKKENVLSVGSTTTVTLQGGTNRRYRLAGGTAAALSLKGGSNRRLRLQ